MSPDSDPDSNRDPNPTPVLARDWPIHDPLVHRAAATPDRTAVVDAEGGATATYRAFDAAVDERAGALAPLAGEEPTVALLCDTRVAFAELALATMRLGGTLAPLNVRLTAVELTEQVERVAPDLLVCERATEETAVEVAESPVASVDAPASEEVIDLTDVSGEDVEPARLSRDSEVLIMFTSGTTGRPKGVRLSLGNLVASATASAFRLGVDPDDRWLCCLPMYHMGGFAPIVRSVLYGTTVVVQPTFDAAETARVLDERDVTGVSLVPTMLRRLLDTGWSPVPRLRFVLLGGAPAPEALIDRCERRDVPVHPTYGMTETASQIATARLAQAFAHEGTVGQPLVNTEVTIVGEDGAVRGPGEVGELVVDGPTVTPGYLDAETTTETFGDHGLYTGDAGYRDDDGRLWILNRVDDRIVTGGENVDPGEVGDVLRTHPDVREAAVVGISDPEWGERVVALVVPAEDASPTVEEIEAHCRERLAGFKIPRTVAFAASLPRTASGTVDRERVHQQLRE